MVHATVCRMFSLKMKIAYHAMHNTQIFQAATRIRTGDLVLTKDALYQLSHSSTVSLLSEERKSLFPQGYLFIIMKKRKIVKPKNRLFDKISEKTKKIFNFLFYRTAKLKTI